MFGWSGVCLPQAAWPRRLSEEKTFADKARLLSVGPVDDVAGGYRKVSPLGTKGDAQGNKVQVGDPQGRKYRSTDGGQAAS